MNDWWYSHEFIASQLRDRQPEGSWVQRVPSLVDNTRAAKKGSRCSRIRLEKRWLCTQLIHVETPPQFNSFLDESWIRISLSQASAVQRSGFRDPVSLDSWNSALSHFNEHCSLLNLAGDNVHKKVSRWSISIFPAAAVSDDSNGVEVLIRESPTQS